VRLTAHVGVVPDSNPDDEIFNVLHPKTQPALVTDLSATGLFFVSPLQYDLGRQIWIAVNIHGTEYPIRAVVVRQLAQIKSGKKIYGYGVQFLRSKFAPKAVAAILDYLVQRISVVRDTEAVRRFRPAVTNGRRPVTLRSILATQ